MRLEEISIGVARTTVVPIPPASRNFHTTSFKSKAESAPVPRVVPLSKLTDNFFDGTSSVYLEELQRAWEADPKSVDESWDNFFRNFVGQTIKESMKLVNLELVLLPFLVNTQLI
ncbi:hypothetical protein AAHE18_10G103300 [Arachis hypogaea]